MIAWLLREYGYQGEQIVRVKAAVGSSVTQLSGKDGRTQVHLCLGRGVVDSLASLELPVC